MVRVGVPAAPVVAWRGPVFGLLVPPAMSWLTGGQATADYTGPAIPFSARSLS